MHRARRQINRLGKPSGPIPVPGGSPSRDNRTGLRHRLLHLENTLMSARGSLDDAVIVIMDADDAVP